MYDVIIVGGGPCGLAAGIEASKAGLSHLILEKGSLTESIRRYPKMMRFFSTAENIEIGGIPFPIAGVKANRTEALQYYRKVAGFYNLNFKLFAEVESIARFDPTAALSAEAPHIENDSQNGKAHGVDDQQPDEVFTVFTKQGETFQARRIILATGYFDKPRWLGIPGEDLPHVTHYYDEPFQYSYTNVVIVGASNSAVEAALELYRADAHVTIVHRAEDFRKTVKYWLIPDVKNRVKEGKIHTQFGTCVTRIEQGKVCTTNLQTGEEGELPADFVLILTGYIPDAELLRRCGVELNEETQVPVYDKETFETNVPGLYVCGTVMAGIYTEKVFIENGREHAKAIIDHIAGKPVRKVAELIERI